MQKSADAFRTISEVAEELDVPQHVLRFWESKFTQIRPLKRAGGRRYYRPDDVNLLRSIRGLLYGDGYTIKGVQKLLKDRGARFAGGGETTGGRQAAASAAPAPTAKPPARRRGAESDPDEMALPLGLPDFLKPAAPSAKPARVVKDTAPPSMAPAQRKKLEKLLAELTAIRALLKNP